LSLAVNRLYGLILAGSPGILRALVEFMPIGTPAAAVSALLANPFARGSDGGLAGCSTGPARWLDPGLLCL